MKFRVELEIKRCGRDRKIIGKGMGNIQGEIEGDEMIVGIGLGTVRGIGDIRIEVMIQIEVIQCSNIPKSHFLGVM